MFQIRRIMLDGLRVKTASVSFAAGANIIAGESETGKSYLLHCIDYILGADALGKRIPQAEPYSRLLVEFQSTEGQYLSLVRHLSGGDLAAYRCRTEDIRGSGEKIIPRRRGKSTAADVTSVLFPFGQIPETTVRTNIYGNTKRLTIRDFVPAILVDEVSIIEEQSPILGRPGYDSTARERMFAFMLSGKDDKGVIAAERSEITNTRLNAQLSIIDDLVEPLEKRLEQAGRESPDEPIERVEAAISTIASSIARHEDERARLDDEHEAAIRHLQRAEIQILAISELLERYTLLAERYSSDLERLDFISEGAYYFSGLQSVACPLCDQMMTPDHEHAAVVGSKSIYASARAEAAKILAQRRDLEDAVASLQSRRGTRIGEQTVAQQTILRVRTRLDQVVQPSLRLDAQRLQLFLNRRVLLEATKNDREQLDNLRAKKREIERIAASSRAGKREWEPLPSAALHSFCNEVEAVLREWRWNGVGRVEFDPTTYDLIVDGQARQSHGKGVRAVLHSAFTIGLLRYCAHSGRSHPGFLVIDSPLTSYKKRGVQFKGADGPIDLSVEAAFWDALKRVSDKIQVIIVENKEPPKDVAASVHYEWFGGDSATTETRIGFIPPLNGR